MKIALFIHRRDLRINDNHGLYAAQATDMPVMPCFIFDPAQVTRANTYRSKNALQCMFNSLTDLAEQYKAKAGKLYFFYGSPEHTLAYLMQQIEIDGVYINTDYTPFSKERDAALEKLCKKHGISLHKSEDYLLNSPESVMTKSGTPYSIFTPFFKRAVQIPIEKLQRSRMHHWYTKPVEAAVALAAMRTKILGNYNNKQLLVQGGRAEALTMLKQLSQQKQYQKTRDFCAQSTTHLSAHLKFGTVSIREAYYAIKEKLGMHHALIRQLYWRDFWTYIAYHNPHVFGHAYHAKYDYLTWNKSKKEFALWCEGNTGFPIIDAGMRELNATGYMHNRVRMLVASFLTKDLHIDWRWGERYFAQQLVDYDPAVNNGNWQWSASTGCDAQPYFRIFNPWLQQKKFDRDCVYIKRWVPELSQYTAAQIHAHYKSPLTGYAEPCVDHAVEALLAKRMYKKMSSS